jgi:ABC-type Mn2+/Zn2+ transport system permease subunit
MNDGGWIVLLVLLLVSTATIRFRARHFPSMRPWLVRHLIGNVVLFIGLVAAWRYDLALSYYVAIIVGVFVMWMWGTQKLRGSVQKNN